MRIPWKIKSKLFRILTYLPGNVLYFAQQHITKRVKIRISEPYIGWEHHRKIIKNTDAESLIEFGAGKNLIQNLYLSAFVKRQTVVDLFSMMDLQLVNEAIRHLGAINADIDGRPVSSLKELEDIYNIQYLAPFDLRKTNMPDDHFDLCISTNTLEHIPQDDIENIFTELRRILKPRGGISAMIDYSDHYSHSDPKIGPLNYLQFSMKDWKKHNHSNHYQNRLRHGHYRKIFTDLGFMIVFEECIDYCDTDGLDIVDDLLSGEESDFSTTGFWHLGLN